ncbi:MAG: chloride channel protein [Gemmatimonadota bacterium]|nr:chloride channel protein [Gemmatimonadota bacterium]
MPLTRHIHWSENRSILIVAVVIGIFGGLGAVAFRGLIDTLKHLFFGPGSQNLLEVALALPWWQRVAIPTVGGLVLAPFIRFFPRETKGHGVPEVMESLALRSGRMRPRTIFTRAMASAITIASGGSVGREGPIVQIGSAIGSAMGQFLKASNGRMKTLVGCGAAAGMAATFNAPLGGALFAIEVILGDFGLASITPIIISSVAATAVSRHFLGNYPAFVVHFAPMVSYLELFFYAILGILAGFLAWLYITVLYRSEDLFESIRIPTWIKPAFGGLIVGTIAIWFPHVYGTGYESIELAIHNKLPILMLLCLVFIKLSATSITIGSGGSGGVFAPGLFQGAMLGGFFGAVLNYAFPGLTGPYGSYALAGMGAMIAGSMHAPITVILVMFELTNDYLIILPVMTCSILSTLMAHKLLGGESIYTRKLIRSGIDIFQGRDMNILRGLKVSDVMLTEVAKVTESTPCSQLIHEALSNQHRSFIQVDNQGRMTGLIPWQSVLEVMRDDNLRDILVCQDIALVAYPVLEPNQSLDEVIRKFGDSPIDELPVIDPTSPETPLGVLRNSDVIQAYRKATIRQDMGNYVAGSLVRDPSRDEVDLLDGFRMVEAEAPGRFHGKTIRELDISVKYGVQIFLIKKSPESIKTFGSDKKEMHFVPRGNDRIDPGDRLVLVGKKENLDRILRL